MSLDGLISAATIVALVVSAAVGIDLLRRHYLPFKMAVREVRHVATDNATHLVALRVAVVNPASAGRTLFRIRLHRTEGEAAANFEHAPAESDEYMRNYSYALPNHPVNTIWPLTLAREELLQVPLDVPPHQSRYRWLPLYVTPTVAAVGENVRKFHLKMDAQDVFGKRLARVDDVFELRDYEVLSAEENRKRNDALDRAV